MILFFLKLDQVIFPRVKNYHIFNRLSKLPTFPFLERIKGSGTFKRPFCKTAKGGGGGADWGGIGYDEYIFYVLN